jgi:hypothetical protein
MLLTNHVERLHCSKWRPSCARISGPASWPNAHVQLARSIMGRSPRSIGHDHDAELAVTVDPDSEGFGSQPSPLFGGRRRASRNVSPRAGSRGSCPPPRTPSGSCSLAARRPTLPGTKTNSPYFSFYGLQIRQLLWMLPVKPIRLASHSAPFGRNTERMKVVAIASSVLSTCCINKRPFMRYSRTILPQIIRPLLGH